jgi:serine O-acetyltransferase
LGVARTGSGKRHPPVGNNVIIGAGAKVLGPITVGDNARIGSNAVVVDPVPADTTVVGVPARPVDRKLPRRGSGAAADFDPYGMPCDDSLDPLLRDLEGLRAELTEVEARVARIQAAQGEFGNNESPAALFDGDGGQNSGADRQPVQTERQTRQPAAE